MIRSRYLRRYLLGGICALVLAGTATAQSREFDIAPGDLKGGLDAYARQSGVQLIYDADAVQGKRTAGVHGALSQEEALKALLSGTGLEVQRDMSGAVAIRAKTPPTKPAPPKKADAAEHKIPEPGDIQEVMVTAQKREERLKDVPIPVTALDTAKLTESGQVLLRDYYTKIPGFEVTPLYEQNQSLTIRGITTGSSAIPTVGFLIDDAPFGSPVAQGNSLPDIDPGDLDRIEVLRGPQGALYGASSMGGLVKFVTKTPSTDAYGGRIEFGTETIENGAEPGFQVRGSGNIPITDKLAVRVSGFERQDPGYIDDPTQHLKGVNENHSDGARLAALWKVTDNFSINLSALYQDDRGDGVSDVTVAPGVGDLQQKFIPNIGPSDRLTQAYSLTMKADFGDVDVMSVTGYGSSRYSDLFDFSGALGASTNKYFGVGGVAYSDRFTPTNLTEEVRVTASIGEHIEWLVGGFLANDQNHVLQIAWAENPISGQIVGLGQDGTYRYEYKEYAGFTDLTVKATDSFSVQLGGRYSSIENQTGPFNIFEPIVTGNTIPVTQPVLDASFHPATYLITPQYKITPDVMVYTRLASGFRPGGGNVVFPGVAPEFSPDTTSNYEVGLKGDFLDHRLFLDTSLYYIDWKDIQLQERTSAGRGYVGNGGRARSTGAELSIDAQPWSGSSVSAWVDYDNAVLTQNFPAGTTVSGLSGNRLPNTPEYSANFSVLQDFPLWGDITGFAGGTVSYVGERVSTFLAAGLARQIYPAYTKLDLNVGARMGGWEANLYGTNVTDERGILEGGTGAAIPSSFYYIRPRTVGLSVSKTF